MALRHSNPGPGGTASDVSMDPDGSGSNPTASAAQTDGHTHTRVSTAACQKPLGHGEWIRHGACVSMSKPWQARINKALAHSAVPLRHSPKVRLLHRRKLLNFLVQVAICAVQRASVRCFLDVSSLNLAVPHGAAIFFAGFHGRFAGAINNLCLQNVAKPASFCFARIAIVSFYGIAGHEIGLARRFNVVRTPVAWSRLRLDQRGITAMEYGIIAAFFCVSLVVIFSSFGSTVTAMFQRVTNGI